MSIAPILTRACAVLDAGQPAEALDLLLTAWRTERRARLGPLLAALSRHLESADAHTLRITAKNKTHAVWMTLAGKCTEADREALLATLTQGTISETKKRLKVVEDWAADPRISAVILRWPVELPFVSTSSQTAWNAGFRCLTTSTEPEALATIQRLSHTGLRSGGSMQTWMASSLPRLAKKMARVTKAIPEDATVDAAIEALRVAVVALTGIAIDAPLAPPEVRLAAALSGLPAPTPAALSSNLQFFSALAPAVDWVAWSGDGERAIARVSHLPELMPGFSRRALLQRLPEADGAALSSDGSRILLAHGDTLRLFSDDGTLLTTHTVTFPVDPESKGVWQARAVVAHPERLEFAVAFTTREQLCVGLLTGEELTVAWLLSRSRKQSRDWSYHLAFSLCGRFLYGSAPLLVYDLTWQVFRQLNEDSPHQAGLIALPDQRLGLLDRANTATVLDACFGWPLPEPPPDTADHILTRTMRQRRIAARTPLPALGGVTGGAHSLGWIGKHLLRAEADTLVPMGEPMPATIRCALPLENVVLVGMTTRNDRLVPLGRSRNTSSAEWCVMG